jgi:hypothetical protein
MARWKPESEELCRLPRLGPRSSLVNHLFDAAARATEGAARGASPAGQGRRGERRLLLFGLAFCKKTSARRLSFRARAQPGAAMLAHPAEAFVDEVVYFQEQRPEGEGQRLVAKVCLLTPLTFDPCFFYRRKPLRASGASSSRTGTVMRLLSRKMSTLTISPT